MSEEKIPQRDTSTFVASIIYPDASLVFTARQKTLQEIKEECLIVLDTNALLVPYSIGKESIDQIKRTYRTLASENRLIIPGQVSREFAKNRAVKIGEVFQQLNRKRNTAPLQKGVYPLLEILPKYQESLQLEKEVDQLIHKYKTILAEVLESIQAWSWDDPVSLLYGDLFKKDCVFDPNFDQEETLAELHFRYLHKIPPGYKDAGKEDEGIGDYLIWKTILELGKVRQKSIIFVSGDEKVDWWHKSEGQPLYPRYELIDEFRRYSEGQSFHILQFSRFLGLYGAAPQVIQEVRQKEQMDFTPTELGKIPSTLVQILEVSLEVYQNQKDYVEAVRIVAERRGVWATTVADKCTRKLGIDTATFRELLENKDELIEFLSDKYPECERYISEFLK